MMARQNAILRKKKKSTKDVNSLKKISWFHFKHANVLSRPKNSSIQRMSLKNTHAQANKNVLLDIG